jgi:membrane protein DedA with SNARE-associated domain
LVGFMITALTASALDTLLINFGYAAVFAAVAIESLGIPVPGETMLVTAAIYVGATHHLSIAGVLGAAIAGAIIGDNIGYAIGYRGGFRLLLHHGQRIRVNERHLKVVRLLFDRYGGRVVFFGRFISILRTYAAFLAGVGHMHWRRFFIYNAAGGVAWSLAFGLAGYYGQQAFKRLSTPLDIVLGIVALGVVVSFVLLIRRRAEQLAVLADKAYPEPLSEDSTNRGG